LDDARATIVEDLGEIPVVSVNFFIQHALPPVENSVIQAIKTSLVRSKDITNRGRWSCFPKDPKDSSKTETDAFRGLSTVYSKVVHAASPIMKVQPRLDFTYKPNEAPVSERTNDTRPDGALELKVKKSLSVGVLDSSGGGSVRRSVRLGSLFETLKDPKSHWEDIVLPCEFKLHEKDYLDVSRFVPVLYLF
jgi:hypothetical protein